MARLNPLFPQSLAQWSAAQLHLEQNPEGVTLSQFIGPTAEGFAFVAPMLPGASRDDRLSEFLARIGQHLGSAIVAVDCALDWEEDLQSNHFNPIRDADGASEAARCGLAHLKAIGDACEERFGGQGRSTRVSRLVFHEVELKLQRRPRLRGSEIECPMICQCASQGMSAIGLMVGADGVREGRQASP
jgi:hypothetical protein